MKTASEAELERQRRSLIRAYAPDRFVRDAEDITALLRGHLQRAAAGEGHVLPDTGPDELLARWPCPEESGATTLKEMLAAVLSESTCQHHPGFVGQQLTAPLPMVGPIAMVSAILNNSVAIFEGAPVGVAIERRLVSWMIGKVGYGESAGGTLTSGGTLGALTALLAMRQACVGSDAWGAGLGGTERVAIFASDQAHYCNARACAILGLGADAVHKIPTDPRFRMDAKALPDAYRQAREQGRRPVALIASAGSTSTGSHDDLVALAAFCRDHDLWLHVDAAHGGSALLSERYAHRLSGIEQADSLVWDAHKMMLMPGLCTAVLVRDARHLEATFRQEASYLLSDEAPWHQPAARNFETTKPTMAFPLYMALRILGTGFFASAVEYAYDLAGRFAEEVQNRDGFELLVPPESNMVCFRRTALPEDTDAVQERLRNAVNRAGRFFINRTRHDDQTWLRIVLMNPATKLADLRTLLNELEAVPPADESA